VGAVAKGEAAAALLWLPVASWSARAAVARLAENGRAREILLRYGAIPSPQSGRPSSPFVLAQAPDPIESGPSLFSTACSRCHGAEGVGGGLGGTVPVIRNYDGGEEKFVRVVRDGKRNTPMAPFNGILTNEEIVTIYQYLTSRPRQ
jgi:mono/diheme cytochrome c family protein